MFHKKKKLLISLFLVICICEVEAKTWQPSDGPKIPAGWWDASDYNTITIATGVSQWDDKSGNSRTLIQATAVNQPKYLTNAINGYSVLQFTNTASYYIQNTNSFHIEMIFFVATANTNGMANIATLMGNGNDNANIRRNNVTSFYRGLGQAQDANDFVYPQSIQYINGIFTNLFIHTIPHIYSGQLGTGVNGGGNVTNYTIGRASSSLGRYWNGYVGEVILYSTTLTTFERQKVEGYLAWKWGLQSSLPVDHPYYLSAPTYHDKVIESNNKLIKYGNNFIYVP